MDPLHLATDGSCRAVLDLAELVAGHPEPSDLVRQVAARLRAVVSFDSLGVLLHDPMIGKMQLTMIATADPGRVHQGPTLIPLRSPGGRVWETQQPLFIPDLQLERDRYPDMRDVWDRFKLRSAYYAPLTTARHRLGTIFFASSERRTFGPDELSLFRFAANQAAAAFEMANLQSELRAERDRLRTLLDVTNALVKHLDLRGLFHAAAAALRSAVPAEFLSLALHDPAGGWDLHALNFPSGRGHLRESVRVPFGEAPASRAFTARAPATLDRAGLEAMAANGSRIAKAFVEEGIRHLCCVPVFGQDRVLGTVNAGRSDDRTFPPDEVDWLRRLAAPIGLAVENALAYREIESLKDRLADEKQYLEEEIRTEHGFTDVVGNSPSLKGVLRQAEIVAAADTAVLVLGETGTGKELVARAIHRLSKRSARTFVKLNCAAIPTGLLESELFGHEKGAFTGAVARKAGRFELADGGTLFLDEVGDISADLQAKLLRVLQEQEFERLGGTKTIRVDVRLVAATNRNLTKMVAEGSFRADLFYRLNVFPIRLPPLRERGDDVSLLARYFVAEFARKLNKPVTGIPDAALAAIRAYAWPGNIRELQNFIERCVLLSAGKQLWVPAGELEAVPLSPGSGPARTLADAEREHILAALAAAGGTVGGAKGAAARLGMKRTTLQSKMKKLGIEPGGADISARAE